MSKKLGEKPHPIKDIKLNGIWNKHIDSVRPAIKELDRKQARSKAQAPFIMVTNSTK